MLQTVVCDDEEPALELMTTLLADTDGISLVAACQSAQQALDHINRGGIDLAVFDIEMPEISGVEAYHQISVQPRPLLIFVTAHSEYAVEAFGVDAIDYIMKPVTLDRVQKAVDKATRLHRMIHTHRAGNIQSEEVDSDGVLRIKDAGKVYFLPHQDIIWVEAAGDYSVLHMAEREITVRMTIKTLADALPAQFFHRVHRSAIISTNYISEITLLPKGEAHIALGTDISVRASRSYREVIQKLI